MAELQFGAFKVNRAGVAETLKQAGVRDWVGREVSRLADEANAAARERLTAEDVHIVQHYDPGVMSDPYEGVVKTGSYDTLGVVRSANLWGAYDSNQHHTLDSLNH